jgi:hypothetical protein
VTIFSIDGDCKVDEMIFPRGTNGHKCVWELEVPTSRATVINYQLVQMHSLVAEIADTMD